MTIQQPARALNDQGGEAERERLVFPAVDHVSEAVLITQVLDSPNDQRISYSNTAFTEMTGYESSEVIGLSPSILSGPETREDVVAQMQRSVSECASFRVELTQYRKDGATVNVECKADPVFGTNGHVSHWIYFMSTIPKNHLSIDNENALQRQELFDTMRRNVVGEIAAGTIHESLQPLYAIGNLAAACRNTIKSNREFDRDKIIHWLDTITKTVGDAKSLLQQLRGFADGTVPNNESISMSEVVAPIARMLVDDFRNGDIEFVNRFERDCTVDVDAAQIRQVIAELVFNSRNCLVESDTRSKRIELKTWFENDSCHVSVSDNGPGVPHETLGEIFKPFYSTCAKRLGLGLSFCKSAIAAHSGTLFAKINDVGGFSVHFTIPGMPRSANVNW